LKKTVTDVFYPFLEKVGILWQSGDVYPAQEHFVSYLIRQKIIGATDRISNTFNTDGKKFLMMLPEGEWHEISLLVSQYIIREANHEVIYLGQSVPYSDVLAIGASKRFDYILFSSSTSRSGFELGRYLEDLKGAFPDKKILYISNFSGESSVKPSKNVIHLQGIQDLTDFIQNQAK
jgi:methanogenic corrinoid protein MtbC1